MSAVARPNPISWSGSTDAEGHRTYKVAFLVDCDPTDGPASVMEASGLPTVGTQWNFGTDSDLWAWCLADMTAEPTTQGETCKLWKINRTFSTKPNNPNRCVDQKIESPLLTPPEVSGDFVKYNEEACYDRFGFPIQNSSHEQIRGPTVEFDHNRQTVKVKMNVALLQLDVVAPMMNTVNSASLWGLPRRCIKLSKAPWSRKFYGSCYVYYEYNFEFDINVDSNGNSGHDRNIQDYGTKVLFGHWGQAPGSGCTVSIGVATVGTVTGVITSASVVAGGTGYQPNSVVGLVVSGGTGGILYASVNASGVITGVSVNLGGNGYAAGTKATTTSASSWVLDNIDGAPPRQSNPSHFIHFKDRKGENTPVVLNGAGLPALLVLQLPVRNLGTFISIINNNLGYSLTDSAKWLPFSGSMADWDQNRNYVRGDVVIRELSSVGQTMTNGTLATGSYDVTGINNTSVLQIGQSVSGASVQPGTTITAIPSGTTITLSLPATAISTEVLTFATSPAYVTFFIALDVSVDLPPEFHPTRWLNLPNGNMPQGTYSATQTYVVGDVVDEPPDSVANTGAAGNIHVEKYDESDFTVLGIPLQF